MWYLYVGAKQEMCCGTFGDVLPAGNSPYQLGDVLTCNMIDSFGLPMSSNEMVGDNYIAGSYFFILSWLGTITDFKYNLQISSFFKILWSWNMHSSPSADIICEY